MASRELKTLELTDLLGWGVAAGRQLLAAKPSPSGRTPTPPVAGQVAEEQSPRLLT